MLNEAEKMKKLLSRVEQFTEFAKKAKSDSEKEQLDQDSEDLKQEINTTDVDDGFKNSLLTALINASKLLAPQVNSDSPLVNKINDRIQVGLDNASDTLDNVTYIIINNSDNQCKPQQGVIGKGRLIDGNTFLEYGDGAKLVYRGDLGNKNKSTYFPVGQLYKNMSWDEAIVELHPINNGEQKDEENND